MNLSTLIVTAVVAVVFIAIVARGIHNKKNGKSACACGGDCAHCGMNGGCHHS